MSRWGPWKRRTKSTPLAPSCDPLRRLVEVGADGPRLHLPERFDGPPDSEALRTSLAGPDAASELASLAGRPLASRRPLMYALACLASSTEAAQRDQAFALARELIHDGDDLLAFVAWCDRLRGWGRGLRSFVQDWYSRPDAVDLARACLMAPPVQGWTHRDVLRMAHPKPPTPAHRHLFQRLAGQEGSSGNTWIEALDQLDSSRPETLRDAIAELDPRPFQLTKAALRSAEVWACLLERMEAAEMLRYLVQMAESGLLTEGSGGVHAVLAKLEGACRNPGPDLLFRLLLSRATYRMAPRPVAALEKGLLEAFTAALGQIPRHQLRVHVTLDASASMRGWTVAGTLLSARETSVAWALMELHAADAVGLSVFTDACRPLRWSRRTTFNAGLRALRHTSGGPVDPALPIQQATKRRAEVDLFVSLTDVDAQRGTESLSEALARYRDRTGCTARAATVGLSGGAFATADPDRPETLDVYGFETRLIERLWSYGRL